MLFRRVPGHAVTCGFVRRKNRQRPDVQRRFLPGFLPGLACRVYLGQHADHLAPGVQVHRQRVDDVGSILAVLVAVAQQLGGDRVTVGLFEDQGVAQLVSPRG